jgi:hypothetical protein
VNTPFNRIALTTILWVIVVVVNCQWLLWPLLPGIHRLLDLPSSAWRFFQISSWIDCLNALAIAALAYLWPGPGPSGSAGQKPETAPSPPSARRTILTVTLALIGLLATVAATIGNLPLSQPVAILTVGGLAWLWRFELLHRPRLHVALALILGIRICSHVLQIILVPIMLSIYPFASHSTTVWPQWVTLWSTLSRREILHLLGIPFGIPLLLLSTVVLCWLLRPRWLRSFVEGFRERSISS